MLTQEIVAGQDVVEMSEMKQEKEKKRKVLVVAKDAAKGESE